ncbi:TatD family hydrolase [Malikia spinosa]|uniref:Uncharacterized protein n=1 Tax=Malikia spinosa TaxID=86180 RepID=A0A7C9MX83_9BURK|nr:hypothetical protein [Malikia spinosa]
MWIDTHCHLDAAEFGADDLVERERARALGVGLCVYPAVERANFAAVRELAHRTGDAYALGIQALRPAAARAVALAPADQPAAGWCPSSAASNTEAS